MKAKNIYQYIMVLIFMLTTLGVLNADNLQTNPFVLAIEISLTNAEQPILAFLTDF